MPSGQSKRTQTDWGLEFPMTDYAWVLAELGTGQEPAKTVEQLSAKTVEQLLSKIV